jgi:hypothetical protein
VDRSHETKAAPRDTAPRDACSRHSGSCDSTSGFEPIASFAQAIHTRTWSCDTPGREPHASHSETGQSTAIHAWHSGFEESGLSGPLTAFGLGCGAPTPHHNPTSLVLCSLVARLRDHDFIALGIGAHGEMRGFLGSVLRRSDNCSARGSQSVARAEKVAHLKRQPRPGARAFTAAMDPESGTGNGEFGHDLGLANDFGIKDFTIESHRPRHVLRPDEVFQFLDVHSGGL